MDVINLFVQFIPILLISLFTSYYYPMVEFSKTVLGKCIGVAIIMFYAKVDILYGVFACAVIIIYYQLFDVEGMTDYITDPMSDSLRTEFVKEHCVDGSLMNKGVNMNLNMVSHVYPHIQFNNGECNPCDKKCDFSIIEDKVIVEDMLQNPHNSNDWFWTAWDNVKKVGGGIKLSDSIGVVSEQFSLYRE